MSADFWAGYLSGAAGIIIGNPLDLIKVRLQATSLRPPVPPGNHASPSVLASPPRPRSVTARNLFRGLPAPVVTYGALNALLYVTYNRTLLALSPSQAALNGFSVPPQDIHHPYWSHFIAGCVAGLATFIISTPTEVVKCRTQLTQDESSPNLSTSDRSGASCATRPPPSASSLAVARSIYQTSGIRGFYHGGVITSVRDAVGYGFFFLSYEASKDLWDSIASGGIGKHSAENTSIGGSSEAAKVLLCGGLAGVATWASIFPLDVIKTRVQTQMLVQPMSMVPADPTVRTPLLQHESVLGGPSLPASSRTTVSSSPHTLGAWEIARHAYKTEGVHIFFRGLSVCCARAFIVNAVQWAVYEWMMRLLVK